MTSGSNDSETRPANPHFEIFARNGKWDWVYYTGNRRALAASPRGYRRRQDAIKAINTIKNAVPSAEIMLAQVAGATMPDDDEQPKDNPEGDTTPNDDAPESAPDENETVAAN